MKKFVCFLAIAMLMAIPISASAELIGNGQLYIVPSGPAEGGYYLDYDADMQLSGITTRGLEVFCVSHDNAAANSWAGYSFYTVPERLKRAAWIADNWTGYGTDDTIKGEAQKAVWEVTGVMYLVGADGVDKKIYDAAISADLSKYDFSGWMYAESPVDGATTTNPNYQDYLVPVPEPATMLLLGVGLLGLAGFGRKKMFR